MPTPDGLAFEVGERHLLSERRRTRDRLTVLHNSGVRVIVDDLGAAAAATDVEPDALRDWAVELFGTLRAFPLDLVKLDPRFVRRLESDERLRAVIDAAHASDIAVVALAVEDEAMATRAAERVGFDLGQGFHFARPRAPGRDRRVARGGMNRLRPRWVAWPHGRPGRVRRARDAVHVGAVLGRAAHDPQPVRRRGSRAGDVPPRLPRVRRVQGGHEPQGLALQDPHQHLHQLVPGEEAPARAGRPRRHRGLLPVPPPRRARGGGGRAARPRPRCSTASPTRW